MAGTKGTPRWARHQIVAAYIVGALGIALFIVQAIAPKVWGVELDFGMVPAALCFIGGYVIFHIKLPGWFGRDNNGEDA